MAIEALDLGQAGVALQQHAGDAGGHDVGQGAGHDGAEAEAVAKKLTGTGKRGRYRLESVKVRELIRMIESDG